MLVTLPIIDAGKQRSFNSFEEVILEVAQHLFGFGFPLLPVRIAFDFIVGFLGMPFLHTLFGFCDRGKAFDKMSS